jgi:hypothetical protein
MLVGFIGLAIDIGHAYVNKSQLQNIADACALAGASALDGTSAGISDAQGRATDSGSHLDNKFEFNQKPLAIDSTWVTYSTTLNGTYMNMAAAQAAPTDIKFVKVTVPSTQPTTVFFGKVIPGVSGVIEVGAEAVAGRATQTQVCEGVLDPFAVPPVDPTDPTGNYGYTAGMVYEVRWSSGPGHTCPSTTFPLVGTTGQFGFADPDGCGPSQRCFEDAILDRNTGANCVQIALNALDSTTGNMGSAALSAMKTRFRQDTDWATYADLNAYNTGYVNSGNGRRVIRVAFTDGVIPHGSHPYNVEGFGCFFMADEPNASPPSAAICLMYIGNCGITGSSESGNTASLTKTVLFR